MGADTSPFSRELELALARIQAANIAIWEPSSDTLRLRGDGRMFVAEEALPLFDEQEREQLKEFAAELEARFSPQTAFHA